MPPVKINFACGRYDHTMPLCTGEIKPEGIDLNYLLMESPREIFDRMAGSLEFDAAEMSSSEYISRVSANECPFVALPVFPSRLFRHGYIAVNRRSGIRTAKDLEGRRVGVPLYTMTAAVWARAVLQHDFGVGMESIQWVQGAMNAGGGHGNPTVMPLLKPVRIESKPPGKTLSQLLEEGAIDATLGSSLPDSLGRNPDVVRLFPDYRSLEKDYYRRTRIFPIMHLVVIRRELHEAHPGLAQSLYQALRESGARARARMRKLGASHFMLPWLMPDLEEIDEVFGGDPWACGVEPNRPTLEALVRSLHEQGMISKPLPVDELFLPVD